MSETIYPTESFFKALNDTFQVFFTHVDNQNRGFEIPVSMIAILLDDQEQIDKITMKAKSTTNIYQKGHVFTEPIGRIQGYEKNSISQTPISLTSMLLKANHINKSLNKGFSY